jgi:transposase InsO family protein
VSRKFDGTPPRELVSVGTPCPQPDHHELWVAELTYLRCWEGVVFFAFVIDAFARRSMRSP